LRVPGYKRNLSIKRIVSHLIWSWRLLSLKDRDWDFVVVCCPPSMSLVGLWWIKPERLWVDVVDLWPEALPLRSRALKTLFDGSVGWVWRQLRKLAYRRARGVSVAAEFFGDFIGLDVKPHWLALPPTLSYSQVDSSETKKQSYERELRLVYLGSMNFVTDLDSLLDLMQRLQSKLRADGREPVLDIIGRGERKTWFLDQAKIRGLKVVDHGALFDRAAKQKVFIQAHWAYNGFVGSTAVGLSYKSMDYLSAGLPLINSLQGDLKHWVDDYKMGLNFSSQTLDELAVKLSRMSWDECERMSQNSRRVYLEKLSWSGFVRRVESFL
jgi:glycosyltransferase involved in cell wall biosynthesis